MGARRHRPPGERPNHCIESTCEGALSICTHGLAIVFALAACLACAGPVILNPSFEAIDPAGKPESWSLHAWGRTDAQAAETCGAVQMGDAPDGECVAQIAPEAAQYNSIAQGLEGLVPGRWYELAAMARCEGLQGHGCFVNLEYWLHGIGHGSADSEHLVGTADWTRLSVRFQAPAREYGCIVSCFQIGGPGKAWFDDVRLRAIEPPALDCSQRRVIDGPFWGMFTCYANYLHQYGQDMSNAGVYWQRMGGAACSPEQQQVAEKLGMAYAMCLDGMPGPKSADDPCYPVSHWPDYLAYLSPYLEKAGPTIRAWEFFNEPNTHLGWTLPAYAGLLRLGGKAIKERQPEAVVATGGFAPPFCGYVGSLLKQGVGQVVDLVMLHPYAVDEGLDSVLFAVGQACAEQGHPDMAIAINETGWATWDPGTPCTSQKMFVSEAEQARNVVKVFVQGLAHRLSFVNYLGWNDFSEPSDHAQNMGLIRIDGSPKPSLHAFKFMTGTIGRRRVADWSYDEQGTRVYRFGGDPPLWVVWNALRRCEATVDVGETKVFVVDLLGAKLTAVPASGRVPASAGSEPVYLLPAD